MEIKRSCGYQFYKLESIVIPIQILQYNSESPSQFSRISTEWRFLYYVRMCIGSVSAHGCLIVSMAVIAWVPFQCVRHNATR